MSTSPLDAVIDDVVNAEVATQADEADDEPAPAGSTPEATEGDADPDPRSHSTLRSLPEDAPIPPTLGAPPQVFPPISELLGIPLFYERPPVGTADASAQLPGRSGLRADPRADAAPAPAARARGLRAARAHLVGRDAGRQDRHARKGSRLRLGPARVRAHDIAPIARAHAGPPKASQRYWGFAAICRANSSFVLHGFYDAEHEDHIHQDNMVSVAFDPGSEAGVKLVQAVLNTIFGQTPRLLVDGDYGTRTKQALAQAIERVGLDGPVEDERIWRRFLRRSGRLGTRPRRRGMSGPNRRESHAKDVMESPALDSTLWTWEGEAPVATEHLGRSCLRLQDTTGLFGGAEIADGVVELELAVERERGFYGVVWRARDFENAESFYVRPHQVGNPDAVQYAPFFNGLGGFQLYHGPGFWAPVAFPLDEWFTIRVVYAGTRAEIYVAGKGEPVLAVGALKRAPDAGRVGVMTSLGLSTSPASRSRRRTTPRSGRSSRRALVRRRHRRRVVGLGRVPGGRARRQRRPARGLLAARVWSTLRSEPTGLVDLARLTGVRDGRNTVLARATLPSARARTAELAFGFSDRAAVYLNGRLLYRGDDGYLSRDYRFLGSIGYFDRLYLPLCEG